MTTSGHSGAVYRDLLEWGLTLPRWQQQLLRLVVREGTPNEETINKLASAAAAEFELQPSEYAALTEADFPSITNAAVPHKVLVEVRKLRNVNALRDDQALRLGPQLTAVYGDNGSGKSGYARVFKRVYRARVVDPILSDVTAEQLSSSPAEAEFVVRDSVGNEVCVSWKDDTASSDLGRFVVLDSACARAYVQGGSLAVGPAGIDVPERFATQVQAVRANLEVRSRAVAPDKRALVHLEGPTEVGKFISGLGSATTDAAIAAMCSWTESDAIDLDQVEQQIAVEAEATPNARRTKLVARQQAVEVVGRRLVAWQRIAGPAHVAEIRAARREIAEAEAAVQAVRTELDRPSSLHRTSPWIAMLSAAVAYVRSIAPAVGDALSVGGSCPLCWQALDMKAQQRMGAFLEYLDAKATQALTVARKRLADLGASLKRIPDRLSAEDEAVVEGESAITAQLRQFVQACAANRDANVMRVHDGAEPIDVPEVDGQVLEALRQLHGQLSQHLASLPMNDADGAQRLRSLQSRAAELRARKSVASLAPVVSGFVERTRLHQALKAVASSVNTTAASRTASELHARHMTERYASLVAEELKELHFRGRMPALVTATNKAKVTITPRVSKELKDIEPERVFSEGERTAIALACFLAELRLGGDPSGLVFDDPVSSLDRNVREHVARRLVSAAKERQVVVFTHDLAFLADLREQCAKIQSVDVKFRTMVATDYSAGFIEDEEPFGARKIKARIGHLKQSLVRIEKSAKLGQVAEMKTQGKIFYEDLRSTWERFIEERLFATVVQRLERNVVVGALGRVPYTPEVGEKVHEGWRRCSSVLAAHDKALSDGAATPSVKDMHADLEALLAVDALLPKE